MNVFPICEVKMLSECEVGQLVRTLRTGYASNFSIVCEVPSAKKRGLIWFSDDHAEFSMFDDSETVSVLAYDGTLNWELDQTGPFEPPVKEIFNKPGCLIISQSGQYLNLQRAHAQLDAPAQFSIVEGTVHPYQERLQDVAIFGAWRLFLEDADRPIEHRIEIAAFCVKVGD